MDKNMSGSMTPSNEDKLKRAKQTTRWTGVLIMLCITALSCVSSFMIYRSGFKDMPYTIQHALAFIAVVVVEGAFVWLVYGFINAFSSFRQRFISFVAIWALVAVMLVNLVTHFMLVKEIRLNEFQYAWIDWGAVTVFIGVLIIVLSLNLADPDIRLKMLELRLWGLQQLAYLRTKEDALQWEREKQEVFLRARRDAFNSKRVKEAMASRADAEAEKLARQIEDGLEDGRQIGIGQQTRGELKGTDTFQRTGPNRWDHIKPQQ